MNKFIENLIGIGIFVSIVLLFMFLATEAVRSHSDGEMHYDMDCCSDNDCAPVTEIIKQESGEMFVSKHGTVHVLPTDRVHRRPSKDTRFHICMRDASQFEKNNDSRTKRPICIYYPTLY